MMEGTEAVEFLQGLLDRRGTVRFPDGEYVLNRPLIIHDDTHLIVGRTTVLRVADHADCSLLDNDGLYTHTRNHDITVEGGIWDGNNAAQEREVIPDENLPCDEQKYISNTLLILVMRMVHVDRLTIKDITYRDPTTYAVQIADAEYFRVSNVTFDYNLNLPNMDGVHIQGPARCGVIENIMGDANDDHVALCANGTTRSEITHGDIEDVTIRGVYCKNGYTGVRLLSCGDAIRNISISEIHGRFRFYAVSFTHHYPIRGREVLLENIHVSDIYTSKSVEPRPARQWNLNGPLLWFAADVNCRNVTIENVYRDERNPDTEAPTVKIDGNVVIDRLTLRNFSQRFAGKEAPLLVNNGSVGKLTEEY